MTDNKYEGMTVNERLLVSGFLDEFQHYIDVKDKDNIVLILKKLEVDDSSINTFLAKIGL